MFIANPKENNDNTDVILLIAEDNLEGHTQHFSQVLTLAYCRIICE
jgi:hypothetical protein